jgi:hypothetical protein
MGCGGGGGTGTVTGTIKSQGKEIPRGLMTFVPDKGEPKSFAIINGKYESGPIPTGSYRVMIVLNELAMQQGIGAGSEGGQGNIGEGLGAGDGKAPPKASTKNAKKFYIDAKYGAVETSGLTFTVEPGANTYDADLP